MKKFLIALLAGLILSCFLGEAKNKKEVQSVQIPSTIQVYEGVTRNGNPKYWIEIEGLKVGISKSNVEKLKSGRKVYLVKWVDENGKCSYSTRSEGKAASKPAPSIDLTKITW